MILPGHVAASVLAARAFRVDVRVAILAAWAATTAAAAIAAVVAAMGRYRGGRAAAGGHAGPPPQALSTAAAFGMGYGVHLLCDSALFGGWLPLFWPWYVQPQNDWGAAYLFGIRLSLRMAWMLAWEGILTALALAVEARRWVRRPRPRGTQMYTQ
jgi:hypothetical protein